MVRFQLKTYLIKLFLLIFYVLCSAHFAKSRDKDFWYYLKHFQEKKLLAGDYNVQITDILSSPIC